MTARRPLLVAAGGVVLVLGLGGLLTTVGPWYHALRRPDWTPPDWVFGPAWTLIGALTAWSAALAWTASGPARARLLLVLFAVNGVLNIGWSLLFFRLQRPDWALLEVVPLWLSVLALVAVAAPRSRRAAGLLTPYLLWVAFAAVLNLVIVHLNPPFTGAATAARS